MREGGEVSPEWAAEVEEGIESAIENFVLLGAATEVKPRAPIEFSPATVSNGRDTRSWRVLSEGEREFIKRAVFAKVGFERETAREVERYEFEAPKGAEWEGTARVSVYETKRKEEGMYLHMVRYPGDEEEFFVSARDFRP